jgi:hypothetical protein
MNRADADAILHEAKRRNVRRIVHFTNIVNLYGMWRCGRILSRDRLCRASELSGDPHAMDAVDINDKLRIDRLTDHINCSIDHINAGLFLRYRAERRVVDDQWCIVCLSVSCLGWDKTIFSVGNAASNRAKQIGIRGGMDGFTAIFRSKEGPATVPQSEVLIPGEIPVEEIQEVVFENDDDLGSCSAALRSLGTRPLPKLTVDTPAFQGGR